MLRPWQSLVLIVLICLSTSTAFAQRIYWTEIGNNRIRVANLTPTILGTATTLVSFSGVRNVSLDPAGGFIYYSETESIQQADMVDGSGADEIYNKFVMSGYTDIAYSDNGGVIFGTGVGGDEGAYYVDPISKTETSMNMSGMGNDAYVGVATNDGDEIIYFANTDLNMIVETDFSGSSAAPGISPAIGSIEFLYFDEVERKIYYSSYQSFTYYLHSFDLDDSSTDLLVTTTAGRITGICAYPQFRRAYYVVESVGLFSVDIDTYATATLVSGNIGDVDILADVTSPVFNSLSPADNSTDIATMGTNLILTFDENVKVSASTGTTAETSILLYKTSGNALIQTIPKASASISGNTVTITGLPTLEYATNYHVLVGNKTFSDLSGNNFIGITLATGWNFTTEEDQSQYYSRVSGNWSSLTTWSHGGHSGSAISSGLPGCTGCDIYIGNGHTVTLTNNEGTVANSSGLTIEAGGTLDAAGFSFSLAGDLTVQGTLLNGGDLISNFGGIDIYNTSGSLLTFNGLVLDDFLNGDVTLHSDIVLINGITNGSGGALNQNGFNVCNGAAVPPTSPIFTNVTSNTLTLSWTAGSGNAFIVARVGSTGFKPQIGSAYTANSVFGSGSQTGAGNFVVYNGTGTTVTITGLSPATNYEFDMYSFSNIVGGCYTVMNYQVTSQTTCITVNAPTTPTDATYCSGEVKPAITVDNPGSGKNINWYDAATAGNLVTGDLSGGAGRGEVFIPSAASGTFYAETYDGTFNCASPTRTPVTLTMHPTLTSAGASALQTVCEGGDPVVVTGGTATGGDGTYTYEWESSPTSGGTFANVSGATSATYDPPSGILATTYFHRIDKSSTCKTVGVEIPVMVVAPPVIVSNPSDLQRCEGETATFSISATGATLTYQWWGDTGSGFTSIANGGVYSGATTNQLQISNVTGLSNARFECRVLATGVCPISSSAAILTVNTLPTFTNQTPSSCEDTPGSGTAILDLTALDNSVTGGVSDRSVSWFTNSGLSVPVPSATAASASNGTIFYAKVMNTLTNCYSAATATVTVKSKPVVAATTLKTICSGTATAVTFSATPAGVSYTWTVSANGNITGAAAGSGTGINQTLSNTSATQQSITYSVTPSVSGCTGTLFTQSVAVDPKPTVFNVTGGGSYCSGTTGVNVGLSNSQSGVTYSLLFNGTSTGKTSSPGTGAFDFTSITAVGTYTISASTAASCAQVMNGSVQVTMLTSPTGGSISSSQSSQLCVGDEFTLTLNGVTNSPTSFNWIFPSGIEEVTRATNSITLKASGGTGGQIGVIASNACGDGPQITTSVTVSELPVVEIVLPERVYVDEAASFSFVSTDVVTPSWIFSDGQTSSDENPVITFTAGGDVAIQLNVTNTNGCTGSDDDHLTVRSSDIGNFAIKNVVTANGDDANGFLYIENIEKYEDSEVILIDRWGTEVFRKKGYDNTWDLKKGEEYLPAGNYICVVRHDGKVYSRTVTVIKNN